MSILIPDHFSCVNYGLGTRFNLLDVLDNAEDNDLSQHSGTRLYYTPGSLVMHAWDAVARTLHTWAFPMCPTYNTVEVVFPTPIRQRI